MPYKAYSKELGENDSKVEVFHIATGQPLLSASMRSDTEVSVLSLKCTDNDDLQIHNSINSKDLCGVDDSGALTEIPTDELFKEDDLKREVSAGDPIPNLVLGDDENDIQRRVVIKHAEIDRPTLVIHMLLGDAALEAVITLN